MLRTGLPPDQAQPIRWSLPHGQHSLREVQSMCCIGRLNSQMFLAAPRPSLVANTMNH